MNEENLRFALDISTTIMSICFGIPALIKGESRKTSNNQFINQTLDQFGLPPQPPQTEDADYEIVTSPLLPSSNLAI